MTSMSETDKAQHDKLEYKKDLCPISGMGKPPTEWSNCIVQCSVYDATTGYCSLQAPWCLQELPHIHDRVQGVANVLEACL